MEETELSTVYMNDLEEEFEDEEIRISKRRRNTEHYKGFCGCKDRNFWGKKCECVTIKEDIRILFFLGDFADELTLKQKKALQVPIGKAKPYNMLDMVLDMNFKFGDCNCEQDEESNSSETGESWGPKELPPSCHCPELPKKRCVLRIIRNDIFQRMKLIKKLNFLLLEKNKKIKETVKKREENDPCSRSRTSSVSFDESILKLVEKYRLLKEMEELNLPNTCLFDSYKRELEEHIGQDKASTKPLRHIYLLEELANKLIEETQSSNDFAGCSPLDKSAEKHECKCPEIEKKIEFVKNFKAMISRLNPISHRKEEMLDFTKSGDKTVEQLVKEVQKEKHQRLADLVRNKSIVVQFLKAQNTFLEEQKLLTDVILILNTYISQLDAQLQSAVIPDSKEEETMAKLSEEKKELLKLIALLNEYKNRFDTPAEDEKLLLEEINGKLEEYLDRQKQYFDAMEKLIPGFKIAIFDNKLEKDRIVAEICRDNGENNSILKEDEKYEYDGRERLRTLLKGLKKPHLHVVGNLLEKRNETSQSCIGDNIRVSKESTKNNGVSEEYTKKNETSLTTAAVKNIFIQRKLIAKLKEVKRSIDNKFSGEKHECDYEILEKEILNKFACPPVPPSPKEFDNIPSDLDYGESIKVKIKSLAFEEGRKIVSQPDPLPPRRENLIRRKRLVHGLGLRCKRGGKCCTEKLGPSNLLQSHKRDGKRYTKKLGPSKLMLRVSYETEPVKDCKCAKRQKLLSKLENDFEDIILQPEKHHIDYVQGPVKFTNPEAVERVKAFIYKHATKKVVKTDSDTDFIQSLSKRKLKTEYDESRFSVVWKDFKRSGMFSINMEAQMMTNERIIIRPQYKKRVKVLSGGRIGLDPLYAEYVCTGMLDGVVLGNERHGPIPRTILQAIQELDSGQGVVIIILNEIEERLSFLFAIEQARKLGIDAELVLARDDISDYQLEKWRHGSRGNAGIILQFKVAAGMAAMGHNLAAIARVTQCIQIATLDCYLSRYGPYIGSGIRHEKGYYVPGLQAEDVLSELLRHLMDPSSPKSIVPEPGTNMILLVSVFKLCHDDVYSIVSFITKRILETGAKVGRVYHGCFSAFRKQGFSITLAKDWNDELLPFLDYPTTCVHWPPHLSGSREIVMTRTRLYKPQIVGAKVPPENVGIVFEVMYRTLREIAFSIDEIMVRARTIGVSLMNVVWIMKPNLKRLPLDRPYLFLCLIGKVLNVNIPVVGKYFNLILVAAAQEFMKDPDYSVTWRNWCKALIRGTQSFIGYTKYKLGDRTMVDYLLPITRAISNIKEGWSPIPFLFGGLEKVNHLEKERKYDLGIMILGQLFRNMYSTLNETVGHYSGEAWWKRRPSPRIMLVDSSCKEDICPDEIPEHIKQKIKEKEKEWIEYSAPKSSMYLVAEERKTEPSIEAGSLEEVEGDEVSIRSAAGALYECLHNKIELEEEEEEEMPIDFYTLADESSSWKFFD